MSRDPPPSCHCTAVAQVVAADKAVWTRLVENAVSPKRDAAGSYAVDGALIPTLESYEVTVHLLPRFTGEASAKKRPHPSTPPPPPKTPRIDGKGLGAKGGGKGKKGSGYLFFAQLAWRVQR